MTTARMQQALVLSLALHAGVVLAVVLAAWLVHRPARMPPVVFELVDPGPSAPAAGAAASPRVRMPRLPPPQNQAEAGAPAPRQAPAAAPSTPPARKTPQRMTKAEFDRLHQKPRSAAPAASAPRAAAPAPKVDASSITRDLDRLLEDAGAAGATGPVTELQAYIARLKAALRAAIVPPQGLPDSLEARVEFHVAPDGTLGAVRITTPSGSPEWDAAVVGAFSAVGSIGPVPGGQACDWSSAFRIREQ